MTAGAWIVLTMFTVYTLGLIPVYRYEYRETRSLYTADVARRDALFIAVIWPAAYALLTGALLMEAITPDTPQDRAERLRQAERDAGMS